MTNQDLILLHNIPAATAKKRWQRAQKNGRIVRAWGLSVEPTEDEIEVVFNASAVKMQRTGDAVMRVQRARTTTKTFVPVLNKRTSGQKGTLLAIMGLCAIASLQNMFAVSLQIKDNAATAVVITALFSLCPFGVIYAGVKGWQGWVVSGIGIAYEVFCNTAGIYRGLSGLGKGFANEVWVEGGFIDTVARMTTIEPKPCALLISAAMASMIALFFLVALIEVKK